MALAFLLRRYRMCSRLELAIPNFFWVFVGVARDLTPTFQPLSGDEGDERKWVIPSAVCGGRRPAVTC